MDNSGLVLEKDGNVAYLGVDQYIGKSLPTQLSDNTTYYIEEDTIELYVNGGTAFDSDGVVQTEYFGDTYQAIINGGRAGTTS